MTSDVKMIHVNKLGSGRTDGTLIVTAGSGINVGWTKLGLVDVLNPGIGAGSGLCYSR